MNLLKEKIGEGTYRAQPEDSAGRHGDGEPSGNDAGAACRLPAAVNLPEDFGPELCEAIDQTERAAKITLGDYHLDAKLYTHLHPFGTGSLRSQSNDVSMQAYLQNRLLSVDHGFRHSPVWCFQSLDRLIKNDLFFRNQARLRRVKASVTGTPARTSGSDAAADSVTTSSRKRLSPGDNAPSGSHKHERSSATSSSGTATNAVASSGGTSSSAGRAVSASSNENRGTEAKQEPYEMLFGRAEPRHIPESNAWWRSRQTELMAISDDHELGLMTGMVTITQNDLSPELIAHALRGPCAAPREEEKIAYLLTRRAPSDRRPNIQKDAPAAVLSFQRRVHATKQHFLTRHKRTPLGVATAFWDRTEAQTRQALHAHILTWNKRRKITSDAYKPRPPIPESQERHWDAAAAENPAMNAEDDVYYRTETARVHAELVRLDLTDVLKHPRETLLWAFLLRAIQTHLYIHACTPLYCLKNRRSCRFFFPWPEQQQQQYCETTQRLALRRRHAPDDQFVVPHNLELAAFSPSTVNVLLFDHLNGAD